MAPKRNHPSSRSSRHKAEPQPKKREQTNSISSTNANGTSLKHASENVPALGDGHTSANLQVPVDQKGEFQRIDRPWGQHAANTNYTVATSDTSPMERWHKAGAYDQPWHGIEAVYIDVQDNGVGSDIDNGMDQSGYGDVETKPDGIDSMICEGSSGERGA